MDWMRMPECNRAGFQHGTGRTEHNGCTQREQPSTARSTDEITNCEQHGCGGYINQQNCHGQDVQYARYSSQGRRRRPNRAYQRLLILLHLAVLALICTTAEANWVGSFGGLCNTSLGLPSVVTGTGRCGVRCPFLSPPPHAFCPLPLPSL